LTLEQTLVFHKSMLSLFVEVNMQGLNVKETILRVSDRTHRFEDADRFKDITKLIAKGNAYAQRYAEALAPITNTGKYVSEDIVGIAAAPILGGVSSHGRHVFDLEEVMLAVRARATIITEDQRHRRKPLNYGAREIARFLKAMGYSERGGSGVWRYIH
jgi:hypothetical protein